MPPKDEIIGFASAVTVGLVGKDGSITPIGKLSDSTATLASTLLNHTPQVEELTNGLKRFSFNVRFATESLKKLIALFMKQKQGSRYYFKQKGLVAVPKRNRTRKKQRPTRLQRRRKRQG